MERMTTRSGRLLGDASGDAADGRRSPSQEEVTEEGSVEQPRTQPSESESPKGGTDVRRDLSPEYSDAEDNASDTDSVPGELDYYDQISSRQPFTLKPLVEEISPSEKTSAVSANESSAAAANEPSTVSVNERGEMVDLENVPRSGVPRRTPTRRSPTYPESQNHRQTSDNTGDHYQTAGVHDSPVGFEIYHTVQRPNIPPTGRRDQENLRPADRPYCGGLQENPRSADPRPADATHRRLPVTSCHGRPVIDQADRLGLGQREVPSLQDGMGRQGPSTSTPYVRPTMEEDPTLRLHTPSSTENTCPPAVEFIPEPRPAVGRQLTPVHEVARRPNSLPQEPMYTQAQVREIADVFGERDRQLTRDILCNITQNPSSAPRRKDMTVENFSGEKDDWADYYGKFENAANWNRWDPEDRFRQLIGHLQGAALGLYSDHQPVSYQALVNILVDRYAPDGSEENFKLKFKSTTMPAGKEPEVYAQELQRLARRGYPEWRTVARDEQVLDRFKEGIEDPELRKHIVLNGYKTMAEAQKACNTYIRYQENCGPKYVKPGRKGTDGAKVAMVRGEESEDENPDVAQILKLVTMMEGRTPTSDNNTYRGRKPARRSLICWCCEKEGHSYRGCPNNSDKHYVPSVEEHRREDMARERRDKYQPRDNVPTTNTMPKSSNCQGLTA
jgi:hypothetical protein